MEILPWKRYSEESLAFGDQEMVIYARISLFLTTLQTERVARCDEMWKRREKARKRSKEGKIKFVWTEWIRADPRLMRSSDYPCEE